MAEAPPKVGDPATVLLFLQPVRVVRGTVSVVAAIPPRGHSPWVKIQVPEGEAQRRLSREGSSWIRGHHADNSVEIRALLATAALERTP